MPRVKLLIADDVGLGKTIEAGLVAQEMLLRHRARRILVVCPATLTGKWRDEMFDRFGLDFAVLDAAALKALRRSHGLEANPFGVFPRTIISLPWLRTPRVQRLLDEVLTPESRHPGYFDMLIVDEAHRCAPPAPARSKRYAVDSLQTRAVRRLGEHSQHSTGDEELGGPIDGVFDEIVRDAAEILTRLAWRPWWTRVTLRGDLKKLRSRAVGYDDAHVRWRLARAQKAHGMLPGPLGQIPGTEPL